MKGIQQKERIIMLKRKSKLSTSITFPISIIVIACLGVLFITANSNMSLAMRQAASDSMDTSLESKTQIIEAYVNDSQSILRAFSRAGEIKNLLKDVNNRSLQAAAQSIMLIWIIGKAFIWRIGTHTY